MQYLCVLIYIYVDPINTQHSWLIPTLKYRKRLFECGVQGRSLPETGQRNPRASQDI